MTNNGLLYYEDGSIKYQGEMIDQVPHGHGVAYWENGHKWYIGEFAKGQPKGVGKYYYPNGTIRYEGETEELQYVGKGIEYFKNGQVKFKGTFKTTPRFYYGARCYVEGHLYDESGKLRYCGTFEGDKTYSFKNGVEYLEDGTIRLHGRKNFVIN
ncbi:toxin-antitoxin system YwqK family antitoxin [Alkalibacillus aidingensis]|uniref:toxin-antitoxin system YwqK family antitoxin n=1 Tax=Alkalibacillus aidingensis TaxID=2747607 RepID=UPI00166057AB|nr:hypothetical protein [Alkalibacillus aidingensis]